MDEETELQGIKPEIFEDPTRGPYWVGLWAVARHWVDLLDHIFEPDVIATTGITRRFALRCRNWMWAIEGLVRRLIIAAAMKLPGETPSKPDASQLARLTEGKDKSSKPGRPASPSVRFSVLPWVPAGQARSANTRAHAPAAQEHRHIGFPGDALLNLFPRHDRRNARPASCRSINPLHRRGRRSRWDPDYQDDTEQAEDASRRYWLHGPGGSRVGNPLLSVLDYEPRQCALPDRLSPYWRPPGDGPEWKRLDQEWARVIPAPRLAGRIRALVRVMQAPERWIARVARRLSGDLLAVIRELPPPKLRKPKLDRSPSGFLEGPLAEAHALIDTS
jgi:hypothetical protein